MRGCVTHYSQRFKAETITSRLAGVRGIVNELSITITEPAEDELISAEIKNNLSVLVSPEK